MTTEKSLDNYIDDDDDISLYDMSGECSFTGLHFDISEDDDDDNEAVDNNSDDDNYDYKDPDQYSEMDEDDEIYDDEDYDQYDDIVLEISDMVCWRLDKYTQIQTMFFHKGISLNDVDMIKRIKELVASDTERRRYYCLYKGLDNSINYVDVIQFDLSYALEDFVILITRGKLGVRTYACYADQLIVFQHDMFDKHFD